MEENNQLENLIDESQDSEQQSLTQNQEESYQKENKNKSNKFLWMFIAIFILILIAVFFFWFVSKNPVEKIIKNDSTPNNNSAAVADDEDAVLPTESDMDGDYADEEEFEDSGNYVADTVSNEPTEDDYYSDSDSDGLSDYEEKILGSNPNNEDTDGDGYLDKEEIEKGFNPNGAGNTDVFDENGICQVEYQRIIDKFGNTFGDCYGNVAKINCEEKTKKTNLVMILDASGSMAGQINGQSKSQIAKEASVKFIDNLNNDISLSIVMYGHKGSNQRAGKNESCNGIEELYSLGESDRNKAVVVADSLKAVGYTPIANALKKAKEILSAKKGENNMVILLSDGEETCDGNPVAISETLKADSIKVNVVGFDIGGSAEEQLKKVATVSGGIYYSARNAEELAQSLVNLSKISCSQKENAWSDGLDSVLESMHNCNSKLDEEKLNVVLESGTESKLDFCEEYIDNKYEEREKSIRSQIERAFADGASELDNLNPANDDGEDF